MKSIGLFFGAIAIANVVALLVLFGWLQATHRLSAERLQEVRAVFADPVFIEAAKEERDEREARAAAEQAAVEARVGTQPVTGEQRMAIIREYDKVRRAELERIQEETRRLRSALLAEYAQFEREMADFDEERQAFERMRAQIAEREGSAQFAQSVKMYETIQPKQAAAMMLELVAQGMREEVVAYLDAMQDRRGAKVIGAIEKEDPQLAAGLLEDLKVFGLEADPEGTLADANAADPL